MRFDQSFEWTLEFLTFTKMKRVFSFLRVFHLSDTPQLCKAQKCTEQISRVSHNEIVVWDISSRKSSGARVKTYLRCPSAPDRNKCHLLFAFISFYLLDNAIGFASKISICFQLQRKRFNTIPNQKREKRNDRVSTLDS